MLEEQRAASEVEDGRSHRLVAVGWFYPGTGLTRAAGALFENLPRWQVDYAGIGHSGAVLERPGLRVHATEWAGRDAFGAHAATALLALGPCDAVLVFNDLWLLGRYAPLLEAAQAAGVPSVAYVPLDGEIVDPELVRPLLRFDAVVVYTKWAREQVRRAFAGLGEDDAPELVVVGHGVDLEAFRPTSTLLESNLERSGRAALRRSFFPKLSDSSDELVVLNASRPDARKRIDLTLAGFAAFARMVGDRTWLCLHHAWGARFGREEILAQATALGIAERLLLDPFGADAGAVDDARLNQLYNACDVGLNTSMGEGWGLVSFEHAATGAAQVVPDHSACSELWRGAAEMVPVASWRVPPSSPLRMGELDPVDVARSLELLWADREHYRHRAEAAYRRATDPRSTWSVARRGLLELLERLAPISV